MIIMSILAGLLSTMNVFAVSYDHVRLHINDIYMVLLMTGWMTLLNNYMHDTSLFMPIISIFVMVYCIRTQFLVNDVQFLKGMIPHHSMAIQMARNTLLKTHNPKIKKLASDIITAQTTEIRIMNDLLKTYGL